MISSQSKFVVFGGQYGSEGKGCVSEYIMRQRPDADWVVIGDAGPNSGHTCSLGKTRNIPAASYFAGSIIIGPDACVDMKLLQQDLTNVKAVNPKLHTVWIHENAGVVDGREDSLPFCYNLEERISSTMTGSGRSRYMKSIARMPDATIKQHMIGDTLHDMPVAVEVIEANSWPRLMNMLEHSTSHMLFECSQGLMLDVNHGRYPFVTSRSTLPAVSLERNGFDSRLYHRCGVFRTFPIRTGGNSGPTGGKELTWEEIGVEPEIATVTKRRRRVFEFCWDDFKSARYLGRPDEFFFTHWDYVLSKMSGFQFESEVISRLNSDGFYRSTSPANFNFVGI